MTLEETKKYYPKEEKVEPKPEPKIEPKYEPKEKREKKLKVVLTLNDDIVQVTKDNKTESIHIVPAPFKRDGLAFVPIETLFHLFGKDELKIDGNKITIERSL